MYESPIRVLASIGAMSLDGGGVLAAWWCEAELVVGRGWVQVPLLLGLFHHLLHVLPFFPCPSASVRCWIG